MQVPTLKLQKQQTLPQEPTLLQRKKEGRGTSIDNLLLDAIDPPSYRDLSIIFYFYFASIITATQSALAM